MARRDDAPRPDDAPPKDTAPDGAATPPEPPRFTARDLIARDDAPAGDGAPAAPAPAAGLADYEGDLDVTPVGPADFEADELRRILRLMMTSRRLDDKMMILLKQGKGYFHIGSSGHEAAQVAVGMQLRGGHDWFCGYYRDLATVLSIGYTAENTLQAHFARAGDPNGGGRQMPEHFGHRELNIMSTSSSVGAQWMPGVGFGLAALREEAPAGEGRVVYLSGGEGSTSQGPFHEALNWAARVGAPCVFHIQDNGYAISVPVEEQTVGGSIWPVLGGYPGMKRARYDGTDFFTAYAVAGAAVEHARAGNGPVALLADVVRLLPHSSSDDHTKYRPAEELAADRARDPIAKLAGRLVEAGVMTRADVDELEADVKREIDELARVVEQQPDPDVAKAAAYNYYEGPDELTYEAEGPAGELVVMVDAINHALDEELARDPRVLVYGEDVGGGKGGVFTATRGLTARHGADRVFNSPLAEASILGSAVGLSASGYMPVVEIQFADYIWPGMDALRNQIAPMRYRSNNTWECPMVVRVPCGGYIHGGLCHSQNIESIFGHFPGLKVAMPSNAADAKGLLKTAIRGRDPVIFLEHKALYRQGPARSPEPHADWLLPFGKARIAREGTDVTIVTWGAIVYRALNAAKALEKEGVSAEVIDIRTMLPLDVDTILDSVRKTGRVLVAYEDHEFMGFGAEIAARIADSTFEYLDAPVRRHAGAFTWIPYADPLENAVLPQDETVLKAAREVVAY